SPRSCRNRRQWRQILSRPWSGTLGRRRSFEGNAAVEAAGNDLFAKLLGESGLRSEVASQGQLTEHEVEIVVGLGIGAAITSWRIAERLPSLRHLLAERAQDFRLLLR